MKKNDKIILQPIKNSFSENIFWVFGVLLKPSTRIKRDIVIRRLMKKKIQTRTFFYPMHKQKIFKKMKIFKRKEKYPNAEFLSLNGFYLPSGLGIKNHEIDYVSRTLNKIFKIQ